jgi:2-dehydro-3-deoxyphosphogluconate aldolase / (4S)-4-hydroxy-2-oxoglutarate aldolase
MRSRSMPWDGVRIVPMVVLDEAKLVAGVIDALLYGGISVIEIGLRTPAALEAIAIAAKHGGITVAAGTLTRPEQVRQAIDAGASFGLAPSSAYPVMEATIEANWPFLPAIATLSEAHNALEKGFTFQKVYPADLLGAENFARSIRSVLPDIKLLPSGGVSESNLRNYLREPNVFAVTGSWIAPRELISAADFGEIARRATRAADIASSRG